MCLCLKTRARIQRLTSWRGNAKFEWSGEGASLRAVARLLDRHRTITSTGPSDRETLLAHTIFRLLVGNTDGHAKNHGLLHGPDGTVTLAPLDDVTPQVLYGGAGETVAMFIDERRRLRDIDADKAAGAIAAHLPSQACRALLDWSSVGLGLGQFPRLRSLEVQ